MGLPGRAAGGTPLPLDLLHTVQPEAQPPSQDRFGRDFYARLREGGFEVVDLSETDEVLEARELVVPTYEYSGRGPVTGVRMTQTRQRGGSRRRSRL